MLLAASADAIRTEHGDLLAQIIPSACLLRRWGHSERAEPLLRGFADEDTIKTIECALDAVDLDAVAGSYEEEGKDPAIYFYEEFLRAHDRANARARGVHYSPPEVVSCMVRGVEWILERAFGQSIGDTCVVDPCCGVGTFLRYIEQQTTFRPRMLGFEIMPAPFRIASCLLKHARVLNADWLAASDIELDGRIPVILGNPPYSGHSSNPGKLAAMMADYRQGLDERNPKWLQDDYVKFIRMAQHHVERAGRGIVAFITNHSYLINPTFRGMRESLARTFDEIYAIDLHGNLKRYDGRHQNIFPIQMGVAISFFVRTSTSKDCSIRYFSIDGTREDKLRTLRDLAFPEVQWSKVEMARPFHMFTPTNSDLRAEFYSFASLFDIFRESTIGFVTSRDRFAIGFTREEVLERIAALRDGTVSDEELRGNYGAGDIDIERARRELLADVQWQSKAVEVLYRPFDRRWAYYSRGIMERPRLPFMTNLLQDNLALAVGRAGNVTGSAEWDVVFCTNRPADLNLFRRGGAKLFPRCVYHGCDRLSNVKLECADADALIAYIYAVLHSTAYRTRYAELLAIDYPRIPITRNARLFTSLADAGRRLLHVHLCRRAPSHASSRPGVGASIRIGGYVLPERALQGRGALSDSSDAEMVLWAVSETVDLRKRIDAIIHQAAPWQD